MLAKSVGCDHLLVVIIMRQCMGAWTDQRHVAKNDIDQLRNLVNAALPEPFAYTSHTSISAGGLLNKGPILKSMHGSELVNFEITPAEAGTCLPEKYRP